MGRKTCSSKVSIETHEVVPLLFQEVSTSLQPLAPLYGRRRRPVSSL